MALCAVDHTSFKMSQVLFYSVLGDTEKYLTRGNLYHPRHTCITRDVVEGNTGVSRVIQVLEYKYVIKKVIKMYKLIFLCEMK